MAADIPSMGYPSSLAMAKALVTYIDCPRRIRSAILVEFERAPGITTIERLRAEHLAPKTEQEPLRANEAYYPNAAQDKLTIANQMFLQRLRVEQAASRVAFDQALDSHYLTRPALVDARWDGEVRAARIKNGEGQQEADAA